MQAWPLGLGPAESEHKFVIYDISFSQPQVLVWLSFRSSLRERKGWKLCPGNIMLYPLLWDSKYNVCLVPFIWVFFIDYYLYGLVKAHKVIFYICTNSQIIKSYISNLEIVKIYISNYTVLMCTYIENIKGLSITV